MDVISPLKIEKVVYGGEGLARDQGQVIFVPFVIPKETITARITKRKKNFANAQVLRIIDPHEGRVKPVCEHFGSCGGCQFQHMDYATQIDVKKSILKENLGSFFHSTSIEIDSLEDKIWNYREHIKLGYKKGVLGYHGLNDKNLFTIKECPIFSEKLPETLQLIKKAFQEQDIEKAEIRLLKTGQSFIAAIKIEGSLEFNPQSLIEFFKGISIQNDHERHDFGNCSIEQIYLDHPFIMDIWSFMQNHRLMAQRLYEFVIAQIPQNTKVLVDLYCGVGVLSILAAAKPIEKIFGIELNPASIHCAQLNKKQQQKDHIHFIAAPSEHVCKYVKDTIDFLIINPPREGISERMFNELSTLMVHKLCYISCNPTTLQRDLKKFSSIGYEILLAKGFDLFPHTTHIETVCIIEKKKTF